MPRFRLVRFRWVMLGLYVFLLAGLFTMGIVSTNAGFQGWMLGYLAFALVSQAIFIFGAGTLDLCKPVRKRRLAAPIAVAALMMTILVMGFTVAMDELFNVDVWGDLAWLLFVLSWVLWGFVFFIYTRKSERFRALKRMVAFVMAGSLLDLVASIPAHVIVSRRPGCLVGLGTMLGIVAGAYVALWSFGPGIALLFLRRKRDEEERAGETPVPRSPPHFSLAGLVLFVLFMASVLAVAMIPPAEPPPGSDPSYSVPVSEYLSPNGSCELRPDHFRRPEVWLVFLFGGILLWRALRSVRGWDRRTAETGGNVGGITPVTSASPGSPQSPSSSPPAGPAAPA